MVTIKEINEITKNKRACLFPVVIKERSIVFVMCFNNLGEQCNDADHQRQVTMRDGGFDP